MTIQSRNQNFETAIDEGKILDLFRSELKNHLGKEIEISRLFVTRVFPRKEGGLTIQYELHLKKAVQSYGEKLILCGYLIGAGQKRPAYLEHSPERCMVLDEIGLVVPVFPFDPALPSLEVLIPIKDQSTISEKLESVLGGKTEILDIEILGYRLEKRCVMRYKVRINDESSGTRKIVAKAYTPSRFAKAHKIIAALEKRGFDHHSPDGLTVPRILGSDPELGVTFMESAPGISLHFLMERDIFIDACSAAGGMLRKLHKLNADGLKNHTKLDELGNLRKLLELIYYMYPELEDTFNKEFNRLSKNAGADYSENVFSHRDFFDKQILFSENRTTLLDCDNATAADPALDVGNFIAHMALRKLQHPHCSDNISSGSEAFMNSYGNFHEGFLTRTTWWSQATRLRLAALYLLRPRWRDSAYKLLTQPIDLFGRKVSGGINEK